MNNSSHSISTLRIGSRGSQLALWQANHISVLHGRNWVRRAKTTMGRNSARFDRIRIRWSRDRITLVSLRRSFGEYYQCGYWAALENRASRLLAAARGSNPLLSAALRGPRNLRICLTNERFLTNSSPDANLNLVLKRGTVSIFQGGLTSRLSLLCCILPRIFHHV